MTNIRIDPYITPVTHLGEHVSRMTPRQLNLINVETSEVKNLGERMGYGRLMQLSQELWSRTQAEDEYASHMAGSELITGPCAAMAVLCGCRYETESVSCDWCCGAGWLTRKVRELQIKESV